MLKYNVYKSLNSNLSEDRVNSDYITYRNNEISQSSSGRIGGFVCSGPGYGSITCLGDVLINASIGIDGYLTYRNTMSGELLLSNDPTSVLIILDGSFCLWASDENNIQVGYIESLIITPIGGEISQFDVSGFSRLAYLEISPSPSLEYIDLSNNLLLENLVLEYGGSYLDLSNNANLATISIFNSPIIEIILPSTNSLSYYSFSGCSLSANSVNSILANAISNGMSSGNIDLTGGTNSAPTGQGLVDKSNLILAGVTVDTN